MFTWIGAQLNAVLGTYVLGVVGSLIAAITPIALTATTIWVALYGWAVLRNEVGETIPTFVWKVFKLSLVLAFALRSGVYISNVADTANALATGVATTFLPASANPSTITTPYALLDAFNDQASLLVIDLLKEAGIARLDLLLAAVICSVGNVAFLCIALFVVSLAKLFLTFVIATGPLFILCLAWRPTQRFFDSWLSMVLNAVVLTWFTFFALGLSIFMGQALVQAVQSQGGFLASTLNAVGESLKYCVVMVLMAIICFQAPTLASALTGGAAVQQGIQMIQNAMMVAGLRSVSAVRNAAPASGAAGGVIRAAGGLPGGATRGALAVTTQAGSLARRGYTTARAAAYRLAALRARA
ncbi:MAG: type IV secretion system protein [Burkholderiaceae bacterium]|nr:type IV secretion system protein [Burkholderiaceae bacterium]